MYKELILIIEIFEAFLFVCISLICISLYNSFSFSLNHTLEDDSFKKDLTSSLNSIRAENERLMDFIYIRSNWEQELLNSFYALRSLLISKGIKTWDNDQLPMQPNNRFIPDIEIDTESYNRLLKERYICDSLIPYFNIIRNNFNIPEDGEIFLIPDIYPESELDFIQETYSIIKTDFYVLDCFYINKTLFYFIELKQESL